MYSDFTKMYAGQTRPTQLERFRQRFMHKLVYFPDNNEGCFGCCLLYTSGQTAFLFIRIIKNKKQERKNKNK